MTVAIPSRDSRWGNVQRQNAGEDDLVDYKNDVESDGEYERLLGEAEVVRLGLSALIATLVRRRRLHRAVFGVLCGCIAVVILAVFPTDFPKDLRPLLVVAIPPTIAVLSAQIWRLVEVDPIELSMARSLMEYIDAALRREKAGRDTTSQAANHHA